jgi:hypothetical protein
VETSARRATTNAGTTGGDAQAEASTADVATTDVTEIDAAFLTKLKSLINWRCERIKGVLLSDWLFLKNLNDVFNLPKFHTGLGLHGVLMLLIWTLLVSRLLKSPILLIYQFFPQELVLNVMKALGLRLSGRQVRVSGSYGPI